MAPRKTSVENDDAILIRLPAALLVQFHELAAENERSTAGEVRTLMRQALAERLRATLDSRI